MPFGSVGFGRYEEVAHPNAFRCALAEFVATFLFVLGGQGSVLAFASLTSDSSLTPAGLTAVALGHAFALFVAISVSAGVSGGHVNPAVTFALFVGGYINLLKGLLYWAAQLAGATIACLFLSYVATDVSIVPPTLSSSLTIAGGLASEAVLTFGLVYTVYATAIDPRAAPKPGKANVSALAPLAAGLLVGANVLFGGAFGGAVMNPARSFGPALVAWDFADHWIFWAGPLLGALVATLFYEILLIPFPSPPSPPPPPLASQEPLLAAPDVVDDDSSAAL